MVYGNLSFFCRVKMIEKRDRSLTDSILMRCKNHSPKPEAIIPLYFDSSINVRLISAAPSCKVYQSMITLQYREDLPFSFDFSSSLLGIPKYMSSSLFLPNSVSPPYVRLQSCDVQSSPYVFLSRLFLLFYRQFIPCCYLVYIFCMLKPTVVEMFYIIYVLCCAFKIWKTNISKTK